MKHGTEYAKRVKRLYHQLVRKYGKPAPAELTDPIDQLVVAILAACTSLSKAQAAFRRLRQQMVDLNELRVTPPMELAAAIGDGVPLPAEKAQQIVNALNDIRRRQDTLEIMFLRQRGRREAREYLESLQGVSAAAAAIVVLHSLGGHAIPVDDLTLYVLRNDELVDPSADGIEVQHFLERHVSATDARAFSELLTRHVVQRGTRVKVEQLAEILAPPAPEPPPPPPEPEPEPPKAAAKKPAVASAKKPRTKKGEPRRPDAPKKKAPAAKPARLAKTRKKK